MLAIRLQRIGKKNRPSYRVVVSEKSRDLYGKHLEILGNYDPVANPKTVNLKEDRIKHWISVGAQCSPTVHNILVTNKVIEDKKVQSWKPKKKKEKEGEEKKEPAPVGDKEIKPEATEPAKEAPVEEKAPEAEAKAEGEEKKEEKSE